MSERLSEHIGYILNNNRKQATGIHFNKHGHNISHLRITILEKIATKNEIYRKEREKYHINKFYSYLTGINLSPQ